MRPSIGEHAEDREAVEFGGEAPTVEVVVFRHGEQVHRELCESADAANDVVAEWVELDGVECVVDDLAVKHDVGEILEPDADEPFADDAYPRVTRDEYD
jgi:hypothetical protein